MLRVLTLLSLLITLSTSLTALSLSESPLGFFEAPLAPNPEIPHPLLSTINYATLAHPTAAAIQPGQLNAFNLTRPEGVRNFYLYVPRNYGQNKTTASPLAIYYHGYSGSYQQGIQFNITGVSERMSTPYLVAFPQGMPDAGGSRGWNAGTCCLFGRNNTDDVEFTKMMIRAIESAVYVDSTRRYAMGWSNGAMMSERLACEAAEQFAGVCADEGAVVLNPGGQDGLAVCDRALGPTKRLNYLHFHGTADPTVSWTGGGRFPSTLDDVSRWVTRLNCSARVMQTFNDGTFSNIVWPDCRDGREVELMTVRNGVHQWWTQRQGNFETAQYAFEWFDRTHRKQSTVKVADTVKPGVKKQRLVRSADV